MPHRRGAAGCGVRFKSATIQVRLNEARRTQERQSESNPRQCFRPLGVAIAGQWPGRSRPKNCLITRSFQSLCLLRHRPQPREAFDQIWPFGAIQASLIWVMISRGPSLTSILLSGKRDQPCPSLLVIRSWLIVFCQQKRQSELYG